MDSLSLTSLCEINLDESYRKLKGLYPNYKTTSSKYHHSVKVFYSPEETKKGQRILALHSAPRVSGIAEVKIEVNPSRFENYSKLREFISLITEPSTLKISRIDHTVDVAFSIEEIHSSILFSRKKSREIYKNGRDLTGFYFGAYPEVLCVYDKAKQLKLDQVLTRIELRQYQDKVAINEFSRLHELTQYKPYSNIQFQKINLTEPQKTTDKRKHHLLNIYVEQYGLQGAYKILNHQSNFRRDFGIFLTPMDELPNLNLMYQTNIQNFFKENSYVQ